MRSLGVFSNGGYADYMMVPHPRYLFDIGDLPPDRAAPLACSGVTTFGALKKVPTLTSEPTVIIGAGGLGLMCLALHKAMGGHCAIVVDIDPAKREAAKKARRKRGGRWRRRRCRATDHSDLTNGGAWAVIDLVGSSQSARVGYDSLIKGGKYVIVGLYGGDLTVSLPPIPMRALTIQGSYVGSLPEMAELIDLVRRTGLPPVPVATRPLERCERGDGRAARRQDHRPRGADAGVTIRSATNVSWPGAGTARKAAYRDPRVAFQTLHNGYAREQCPPIFISRSRSSSRWPSPPPSCSRRRSRPSAPDH